MAPGEGYIQTWVTPMMSHTGCCDCQATSCHCLFKVDSHAELRHALLHIIIQHIFIKKKKKN